MLSTITFFVVLSTSNALVPFIDGGKGMPKLHDGWFNDQIGKQASTAVSKAIAAGKVGKTKQSTETKNTILFLCSLNND